MTDALLLVDDEENVLRSLRRLFRQEPYEIFTASSGEEGLSILASHKISVILSDQRMPGMIGSEFLKIVKERYPDTIRIVMSGYTELESVTSAINDGAIFKFLVKPWEDEKLLIHIREAFSYHELRNQNLQLSEELKILNKNLEEKIEEERERSRLKTRYLLISQEILDNLPIAVFGISNDGLIVMANLNARNLIGQEAVVGNNIDNIFPTNVKEKIHQMITSSSKIISTEMNWPTVDKTTQIRVVYNHGIPYICLSIY